MNPGLTGKLAALASEAYALEKPRSATSPIAPIEAPFAKPLTTQCSGDSAHQHRKHAQHSTDIPERINSVRTWRAAITTVTAAQTIAAHKSPFERVAKVKALDAYSLEVKEKSMQGGFITALVLAATIAYIILVTVQFLEQPPMKVVGTEWTIGNGPWPMDLTCQARSGCLVSNVLSAANTLGSSNAVPADEAACTFLAFNNTMQANVVFSVNPVEGLSVMYDPDTTAGTTSLEGAGLDITSEIRCVGGNTECVTLLHTPIASGTFLLQYVETMNNTASGAARHRREWFANMISGSSDVLSGSTPCWNSTLPDPRLAGWVQARLRINSFYNTVQVDRVTFWLTLFGTAGGAYSLFLQVGAILLVLMHWLDAARSKWFSRSQVHSSRVQAGPEAMA